MIRSRGLSLILILSGILLLAACKKENNNVGIDIQPPNDRLGVEKTDTVTVISYSRRVDSVKTDETNISLLGSLNDPIFGTKTANVYTQFRLSQVAGTFGDNPVLDSLILTLDFASIYGDSTATLTLDVFEMSESIYSDSSYYSDNSTAYYPELIASKTFTANLVDSIVVNGDTLPPHLRINLSEANPAFAEKLLGATPDDLNTQDNFLEFFKGLYLKVQEVSSGGAIISVDLLSSLSEMVLYYSNDEEDSLDFNFAISSFAARYGQFRHNYSVAQPIFQQQVLEGDTSLGKTTCYVQSMAGVKTVIKFPFLRSLKNNGNIAINEARLFLNVQEEDPSFPPALSLVLVGSDGEGGYSVLEDQLEGTEYFGGIYDEDNHGYWFRITSSIQEILSQDDPDHGFELFIAGGSVNAQRCVLTGSDPVSPVPQEERMRLVITYSKVL